MRVCRTILQLAEATGQRIQIVTGPNGSGKSVYLQTVGLLVLLAQAGRQVFDTALCPRQKGRFSGLWTDWRCMRGSLNLRQECEITHNTSSFADDMWYTGHVLRLATKQTLVLFDEFGKGTCVSDGIGLFCATIEHMEAREVFQRVAMTTHFHGTGLTQKWQCIA